MKKTVKTLIVFKKKKKKNLSLNRLLTNTLRTFVNIFLYIYIYRYIDSSYLIEWDCQYVDVINVREIMASLGSQCDPSRVWAELFEASFRVWIDSFL